MIKITSTSGYMKMDFWLLSYILQLGTMEFCQRFLDAKVDPKGRWLDQMTQAARSITENIAEGASRHQTSRETEMKLIDVARASANELAGDFMFWLSLKGEVCWSRFNPEYNAVRQLRLDEAQYNGDELIVHEAMRHVLEQKKHFDRWFKADDITFANALLVLCNRVIKMTENQLDHLLDQFRDQGGFTENMTQERLNAVKEKARQQAAPRCPKCGSEMRIMVAKKGVNAGHEFWGCTNFPECNGTIKKD